MADEENPRDRPPSKSQLKRDAHALQKLGTALIEVPESDWQALQLPEALVKALHDARHMPSHGAHKRQLQLIGKLMRDVDPEPIQAFFDRRRSEARQQTRLQHETENWRDRMISEGDTAIDMWLADHPGADRQHLRQLVRQAKKEQAGDKPPRSSRTLFRYLRDAAARH
jgi:ribosome-associated protein